MMFCYLFGEVVKRSVCLTVNGLLLVHRCMKFKHSAGAAFTLICIIAFCELHTVSAVRGMFKFCIIGNVFHRACLIVFEIRILID